MLARTDLLPFATGALLVDVLFLLMNYFNILFKSSRLTAWYTHLGPSAVAMDTLIILIVTNLGVAATDAIVGSDATLAHAALGVMSLQIVHDVGFAALFLATPRGTVYIFDVFKDYAAEVRYHAIWADTLMVLGALFVAEALSLADSYAQIMVFLSTLYVALHALYIKPPCTAYVCDPRATRPDNILELQQTQPHPPARPTRPAPSPAAAAAAASHARPAQVNPTRPAPSPATTTASHARPAQAKPSKEPPRVTQSKPRCL